VSNKLGRPRIMLDEELIARLIGKAFTVQYVAEYLGVSEDTLHRNYSGALRKGRVFRNGCLQAKQYQTAMAKNNVTMQIWLGKQWLGQKDKIENSEGHKPLEPGTNFFQAEDTPSACRPN
jgi:hypothetical protein